MLFLKKFINLLFITLVFFLIAFLFYFVFTKKAIVFTSQTLSDGIIAFFGAFFAFSFIKFSDWLSIIRKSNIDHFNALVIIERFLNRIISRLDRNIALSKDDINALKSMKILVWNLPSVPYNYELSDDLKNIDFINDYLSFTIDIDTLNNDIMTIISMYEEIKRLFIDKTVGPEIYKDNVAFSISRVSEIIKFMENYQLGAINLLAKARILLKERKHQIFLVGTLPKKKYGKDFIYYLKKEVAILEKEIETTKRNSQQEIDRIIKSKSSIEHN